VNPLARLDPRRSLAAAITWLVIALSASLVLATNFWLRGFVRSTLLEQHGQRLEAAVEHVSAELDTALILHLQSLSTVAAMLKDDVSPPEPGRIRRALATVRGEMSDLAWLAITDANGDIVAATDERILGRNLYQTAWLSQGRNIAWVEEGLDPGERFLELTAPLRDLAGVNVGVVAARLNDRWLQALVSGIRATPGEWLLIDREGRVRIGPPALRGQRWQEAPSAIRPFDPALADLGPDGSDLPPRIQVRRIDAGPPYLVAHAVPGHATLDQLGWRIAVIEPAAAVAAFATDVEWRITVTLLVLGAAAALVGVSIARRLTRRIRVIARSADALSAGQAGQIEVPAGQDEAARLGAALDRLLGSLQRERDGLRTLNAELDQRVAQRTEEIRRLAAEARDAAVVRERLRLARDLHDTLAHSMMAMLTEIRLLKRLASTRPSELPDELVRAEQAAHDGLREARLAIAELRSHPARDVGLGPALAELLEGFGRRSGVSVEVDASPEAAGVGGDRADTLFRIVEELLRNVERHADARRVTLGLQVADSELLLTLGDDGVGFEPGAVGLGHYGLAGVREQAEMIGARLELDSAPGQGTTVRLRLALGAGEGLDGATAERSLTAQSAR
jgi:signal transduction histidine kinase